MTEERKITYGDIMNLEKKLLDAPKLPRAEQSVKDKKEALSLLSVPPSVFFGAVHQ